jgi:hypothetical protein
MGEAYAERKHQFTPPLLDDFGEPGWFQIGENGHLGYLEFLNHWDPYDTEEAKHKTDVWYFIASAKLDIEKGVLNFFNIIQSPFSLSAPKYGPNLHEWMLKFKEVFDPGWIANPPFPHCIDELVERCEWLKKEKDW